MLVASEEQEELSRLSAFVTEMAEFIGQMMVDEKLQSIDRKFNLLIQRDAVKDCYRTDEFARLVGKAEFTVRER